MNHKVYIIKSLASDKHYIGSTESIEKRIREHNSDRVRSTKGKGPYKLIYMEEFLTRTEARKRENQIKRFKGNSRFKKLINDPIV